MGLARTPIVGLFALACAAPVAFGQISVEEAKRRMEERRKSRPASVDKPKPLQAKADQKQATAPELPPPPPQIWKARSDAPPEIQAWLRRFPQLRQAELDRFDERIAEQTARLAAVQGELASAQQQLRRVERRPVGKVSFQNTLGQTRYRMDKGDRRRKYEEKKEQQAVVKKRESAIRDQEAVIAGLRKKREVLAGDTLFLPMPDFRFRKGSFGHLTGGVRIVQIIDEANCIVHYEGADFWLEGCDTTPFADDQHVPIETPVTISGNRQFRTVLGASRTVYVLKPFEWATYVDAVEVSEAEAVAFWKLKPVGGAGGLRPIRPTPDAGQPQTAGATQKGGGSRLFEE